MILVNHSRITTKQWSINTKLEKILHFEKIGTSLNNIALWVALRCLQEDSIKCLCKIRKAYYPVKLNMPVCIYTALAITGHMLCGQQISVKCHRYIEVV